MSQTGVEMAQTRLSYAEASQALLRETLLTAVDDLIREKGWNSVTMADVAARVGVSRQTVYNEFGSRPRLAQAYILREVDHFVTAIKDTITAKAADPHEALAGAFDLFLTAANDTPFVKAIVSGDGADELLVLVTSHGGPTLERATEQLGAILKEGWPQADPADVDLLAECVVRLAISNAALPSTSPDRAAANVVRLLGPFIDEALGVADERPAADDDS